MFKDYQIDPNDSGEFIEQYIFQDLDHSTENGIMMLDNPKELYPYKYKYFVRVGGGWRAFNKKVNAKRYYNQD